MASRTEDKINAIILETMRSLRDIGVNTSYVGPIDYDKCYSVGILKKSELVDGEKYIGICRNATIATWHAAKDKFTYIRSKWGCEFPEDINHLEDDNGFDLFFPIRSANHGN